MRKKLLSVLLATAMVTAMLTGCGSSSSTTQTTQAAATTAGTTTAAAAEPITISMWHTWPEANGGTASAFAKTIEDVQAKYPEVTFEMDAVADSGDSYKTKIKTAAAGGELPDIFFTWGGGFSDAFVEGGKVLCLDDYTTQETLDRMISGTTDFFKYNDKLYGYPLRANVGVLFCNKAMFDEVGLAIPTTFDELLEVCKAFNEKGTVPFAIGAKNLSDIAWWTDQLTQRTAGADYVNQILAGTATYDCPETLAAAQAFTDLIAAGAFDSGASAMSRDEAYTLFTSEINPMYFCGSWYCSNVMNSEIADKVVVTKFPTIEGGKGANTEFLGGADQTFMINSNVKNPEKVVEVYTYMCERLSENVLMGGAGLPAWKTDADVASIDNKLLADVYDLYKGSTGVSLWWDNALLAEPATNHMDAAGKLFLGGITPEEFVKMNTEIMQ
ncbi:P39 [uncultured Clostridium sp.]|uniref:extracellular solute-binding protein n=1 Tax=Clostridia TaxID=186801 RepID=UPI0005D37980|nr:MULTISPECIES: extracellular solute-binding protein [Clostridia]KJJ71420.1 multiple sugar-binding protein precursor [Clostridium sp. FS41]SCH25098.1 P39 [uncultured Clostridium sp.]